MQLQSGEVQLLLQALHPVVKQLQRLGGVRHRRTRLQVAPRVVKRKETTVTRGLGTVADPGRSEVPWGLIVFISVEFVQKWQKYNP